jgi:glutamate racemase
MQNNNPIGLFDSGIGGTSIWKEIDHVLPFENSIYLADSKNAPYGRKSKEEIIELCFKNTEYLLEQNCKLIVVACNTATTNAITELRQKYDIPFIGIEPAIKPAVLRSKTQTIGILATKGTLNSALFHANVKKYTNVTFVEQVGTGLVELIETGKIYSQEMTYLLTKYLSPMIKKNIDYLVLGCSHYPYLIPQIRTIIPSHIEIIDSGYAVAKQTLHILSSENMLFNNNAAGCSKFYTNGNPEILASILGSKYEINYLDF